MATHDYNLANATGAAFRADLNNALSAIATNNSNATDPATTFAYQWYVDTTNNLLKIRDGANSAYIEVGDVTAANFGLAKLSGATFTGDVVLNTTTALQLPAGTTAQRPGSPTNGDIRYNSTTTSFEGYAGGAWGAIGGAGATGGGTDQWAVEHDNTITTSYTITAGKNVVSAGPLTVNSGATVTVPSTSSWVIV